MRCSRCSCSAAPPTSRSRPSRKLVGRARGARVVLAARKPEALRRRRGRRCAPAGASEVDTRRVRRHRLRVARELRRRRRSIASATSTSSSSRSACSATRPAPSTTRPPRSRSCRPTSPAWSRSRCRSSSGSGRRATARSCCCRRSRASACAGRTSSTARRRPASTATTRVSAAALAASGVHVMIVRPGFVHTKMTAGMKAAPLSVDARRGRRRGRARDRPRPRDRVGTARDALRDGRCSATCPTAVFRRLPDLMTRDA